MGSTNCSIVVCVCSSANDIHTYITLMLPLVQYVQVSRHVNWRLVKNGIHSSLFPCRGPTAWTLHGRDWLSPLGHLSQNNRRKVTKEIRHKRRIDNNGKGMAEHKVWSALKKDSTHGCVKILYTIQECKQLIFQLCRYEELGGVDV